MRECSPPALHAPLSPLIGGGRRMPATMRRPEQGPGITATPMSALLADLYQFTMLEAYLRERMDGLAVFELFVRRLPRERRFLVAAGLEQVVQLFEQLRFDEDELEWLARTPGLSAALVEQLRRWRFTGDLDAMPEGTVFFADEPVLRVTAPLPQAQLIESRLLNLLHFQTLIASKAARVVAAARGRLLVDFGMRRAHGAEAALLAARAAYLAGFAGTATVEAGQRFGIPVFGTMAHSFVQAHASERAAFVAFARARPERPTLLIDTYDTERGAALAIDVARELAPEGIRLGAVRIDSGDLGAHACAVRALLDAAGLGDVSVFASGNLDDHRIEALLAAGAPIGGFGVGTALDTSADVPSLDAVYKLQSYAGQPRRKRSEGKATWPGAKQVWREFDAAASGSDAAPGLMRRDHLGLVAEAPPQAAAGQLPRPLLQPVLRQGKRVADLPGLAGIRAHHAEQLRALPPALRSLELSEPNERGEPLYPVEVSAALRELARRLDATPGH
jgi:nicotinate phosphoribosyltransferase